MTVSTVSTGNRNPVRGSILVEIQNVTSHVLLWTRIAGGIARTWQRVNARS